MEAILFSIATFFSTYFGGRLAMRFKDKLHLITGFSAGAVIGVAFFDLMPEALELRNASADFPFISLMICSGFVVYLILDRMIILHYHNEEHCENPRHRGILTAGSLSLHSFLDGIVIGLAFQASSVIGTIVTIAVLAHDFSDGINTVSVIMKNNGDRKKAFNWLIIDAAAPVLGIFSTLFFSLPKNILGTLLAIFCGFFLYIGASDLLPESHHAHPKKLTTIMTLLGILFIYLIMQITK